MSSDAWCMSRDPLVFVTRWITCLVVRIDVSKAGSHGYMIGEWRWLTDHLHTQHGQHQNRCLSKVGMMYWGDRTVAISVGPGGGVHSTLNPAHPYETGI